MHDPQETSPHLTRDEVRQILLRENEPCTLEKIWFYQSLAAMIEKVCGSKTWAIGEIFVFAESKDTFVVMKQIAPDSCEMLTITHKGYRDVYTAYRFQPTDLLKIIEQGF